MRRAGVQEGKREMFDVILNEYAVKLTADLENRNSRYLAREIRRQNRAARVQQREASPRGSIHRALAAVVQQFEGYAQQWAVLFEG